MPEIVGECIVFFLFVCFVFVRPRPRSHSVLFTEMRKGRYTLGDKLQQHVAATRCSDKSLRVYCRIFVKIVVAATEFVAATSRTDSV